MMKLTVAVPNTANASKNVFEYRYKKHPQNSFIVIPNYRKIIIG